LDRILLFDDFNTGLSGWTELIGNYEHTLDSVLLPYQDHRPPQLSSISMWDTGTVGALNGTYSLKVATRAKKGHQAVNIKRITFRKKCKMRLEAFFTFKPEATKLTLSDQSVRSIGFLFDLQNENERVMPHIRYLNSLEGTLEQKWQYKKQRSPFRSIGTEGKTVSHYHLSPEGWEDIPGGKQKLCYNEIATKHNWHYLRLDFDLDQMKYYELQCNEKIMNLSDIGLMRIPAMPNLWNMLNLVFFTEADEDRRVFFYLDSVLLTCEE
jgi:hypothetical protein